MPGQQRVIDKVIFRPSHFVVQKFTFVCSWLSAVKHRRSTQSNNRTTSVSPRTWPGRRDTWSRLCQRGPTQCLLCESGHDVMSWGEIATIVRQDNHRPISRPTRGSRWLSCHVLQCNSQSTNFTQRVLSLWNWLLQDKNTHPVFW